jgi:DNA ligase 4
LLIRAMKIDKNSDDGYSLLHWKDPGKSNAQAGDFARRCYDALSKRPMRTKVGDMTIEEVNDLLDDLSAASKEHEQLPIFEKFYKRMNPEELQWLIRIVLKAMKVGATERTFLTLFHEDAEKLFNVSSNLRRVCWELYDPNVRLDGDDVGVALMQCFQPMLAGTIKHVPLQKVIDALRPTDEDSDFWMEEKLDGERMQMHMVTTATGDKEFKFWSRKAKDYTYLYGKSFDDPNGALTRSIKNCFAEGVENIILDGEMITWDPAEKAQVPFGSLKTAALAEQSNPFTQGHRPLFRIFDILLLNDQPLTRYTLRDRRKALAASIKSEPERFEIHEYIVATTVEDVEQRFRQVIAEASEGLVLKNPRSAYILNDRSNDWQKLKPEYMEGFGEDLDCVIIGGYYGSGRRGGNLSSFLCGLRASRKDLDVASQRLEDGQSQRRRGNTQSQSRGARRTQSQSQSQSLSQATSRILDSQPTQTEDDDPVENFTSFFKVGGGMTANDYATIRHATDGKWHTWSSRNPAAKDYIDQGDLSKLDEKPDMWIKPSDSLVVQVKAAQVVESEDYGFRQTLRFPRFVRLRRDRDWTNALSVNDFLDLRAKAVKDEEEKKIKVDQKRMENRKARTGDRGNRKRNLTIAGYNARDVNAVKLPDSPQSKVFEGLTMYIMTESSLPGLRKKSKLELEAMVKANGGKIVQTATPTSAEVETVLCIAARRTVKVASVEKRGEMEIIKPAWLFDCIDQAKRDFAKGGNEIVLPLEPSRHLFFTPETKAQAFVDNIDSHGDSMQRDTDAVELGELMAKMGPVKIEKNAEEQIPNIFGEDFLSMKGFLFHGLTFYFDDDAQPAKPNGHADIDREAAQTTASRLKTISTFGGAHLLRTQGSLSNLPTKTKQSITHIVACLSSELPGLRKEIANWSSRKIPRIVTEEWIEVCWQEGQRIAEERFTAR